MSRTVSDTGLNFIALHEGFVGSIYKDAAGLPTIGFGHLLREGEHAKFKSGITREQGKVLLKEDIAEAEKYVNFFVKVPLSESQFDALVSFVFNIGAGNFRSSTLLKKINGGDYDGAANEFLRWVRAGGKVLLGLQRRRAAERKMFLS